MEIINFTESQDNSEQINFGVNFSEYPEQDLNYRIALCVINVILCLTTLLGNTTFLITIWKTSLHPVVNILLSSLAVSDLAVGLVSNPLFIANILSEFNTANRVLNIMGPFLAMASFLSITAIGIDRLLALQLHLSYEAVVTSSRATFAVIFIWVFSGMCSSTVLLNSQLYFLTSYTVIIGLLVANFVVYVKIYLIVRRHQRQIQQQQQQQQPQQANNENIFSVKRFKNSAINTFLVFILILCCYMPYSVCVSMLFASASISQNAYSTTVTLIYLNSSLNPLLYCWRDREIRTAMKQFFHCR